MQTPFKPCKVYQPGEFIGRYRVLSPLGMGGTCAVYRVELARDPRPAADRQFFAVKVPLYEAGDVPEAKLKADAARLTREFKTLRKLKHDSIIQAYTFGWHRGVPYYAMQYLDGYSLSELIAEERPSLRNMMSCFIPIVDALAYLHAKGVCHRDIKLSNILVTMDGRAILLDFGLCRSPGDLTLTKPGDFLGTLPYISPEYADFLLMPGRDPDDEYRFTPSNDVFSLGVTLYHLLTGRLPWKSEPGRQWELLQEIRGLQVEHPCFHNPRVPRPLADFSLLLLKREDERPAHGEAVLEALYATLTKIDEEELKFIRTPVSPVREVEDEESDELESHDVGSDDDESGDDESDEGGLEDAEPASHPASAEAEATRPPPSLPSPPASPAASTGKPMSHRAAMLAISGVVVVMIVAIGLAMNRQQSSSCTETCQGENAATARLLPEPGLPAIIGGLPMPSTPIKGQKLAPCNPRQGETEIKGTCWVGVLGVTVPCPAELYEYEGACYRGVAEGTTRPPSSLDGG